ncbi:hypothetical protein [Arthrobacter sp. NPDC089319]|uniref:hypothetical protein n=1 Tax=Arthrobacter sp. NPDC089319 TaxID=3155915 RepID=UPI00344256B0
MATPKHRNHDVALPYAIFLTAEPGESKDGQAWRRRVNRRNVRRLPALVDYATGAKPETPSALRHPFSASAWASLTFGERMTHLSQRVHADAVAEFGPYPDGEARLLVASDVKPDPRRRAKTKAQAQAQAQPANVKAAPAKPEPEPHAHPAQDSYAPGTLLVQCAGNCGAWLPARSPRPVLLVCKSKHPAKPKASDGQAQGEASARVIGATIAAALGAARQPRKAPANGHKGKRSRVRAVCVNSASK